MVDKRGVNPAYEPFRRHTCPHFIPLFFSTQFSTWPPPIRECGFGLSVIRARADGPVLPRRATALIGKAAARLKKYETRTAIALVSNKDINKDIGAALALYKPALASLPTIA